MLNIRERNPYKSKIVYFQEEYWIKRRKSVPRKIANSNTSEPHKGPSKLPNPDFNLNSNYLHDCNLPRPIIYCFDPLNDVLWKNSKHESRRERKDLSEKVWLIKIGVITNRELNKTSADQIQSENMTWICFGILRTVRKRIWENIVNESCRRLKELSETSRIVEIR